MIQYTTVGYDLTRNSISKNIYTHAVVFNNITVTNFGLGATWHTSKKLAEASARQIAKRSHLELIAIAEVVAK